MTIQTQTAPEDQETAAEAAAAFWIAEASQELGEEDDEPDRPLDAKEAAGDDPETGRPFGFLPPKLPIRTYNRPPVAAQAGQPEGTPSS
ncbi:hypothetical protein [Streptomyces noursei]